MPLVTAQQAAAWGQLTLQADDLTLMGEVVAAVELHIAGGHTIPEVSVEFPLPADLGLAIKMQAVRLWKRRGTPEGITAFESQFGALRVSSLDHDVAQLLAPYRTFAVG